MAIFIPDLFGGYLRGRQAAIDDNWTDLNQFNQVLGGQMQNAFDQQVMADRARIANASANLSDMNQAVTGATTDQRLDLIRQQKLQKLNEAKARLDKAQLDYETALAEYNQQNLDPKVAGQRAQTINSYTNPQPVQAQTQAQNGTANPQNGATNGSVLNLPQMQ